MNTEKDLRVKVSETLTLILKSPTQLVTIPETELLTKVAGILDLIGAEYALDQVTLLVSSQVREMKDALAAMEDDAAKLRSDDWIPESVTRDSGMLSTYLKNLGKQGWDPADIVRLRMSVLSTLGSVGNPKMPQCTYGLVVGRVQSGKTTHYVALILAALAAGYQRILVLGGHTNSLRAQCQRRLQSAFHSLTPDGVAFATPEFGTTDQEEGDLTPRSPVNRNPDGAQIFVCKKNVTPLKVFRDKFGKSTLSLLIIDDEADWGTQNVARDPEQDQTQINGLITEIIDEHPEGSSHRAYVAYTATPYANLLVSEDDAGAITPQYVKVIAPGRGYLGNDMIVGSDDDSDDDFLPIFVDRKRSDPSRAGLTRVRKNNELRDDLEDVIIHYALAAAGYRAISAGLHETWRPKRAKMLINDSTLKDSQGDIRRLVSALVKNVMRGILINEEPLLTRLKKTWESQYVSQWHRFTERLDDVTVAPPTWAALMAHLVDVANALVPDYGSQDQHVRIINSDNDAWTAAATADREMEMIYIGGLVFARGVTIDGLTTVLFAAPPGQQDTLMQYARWLGYRGNFAPLLRVLLPGVNKEAYAEIARLDRKLWAFLKYACDEKLSPAEAKVVVPRESRGVVSRPTSASKTRLAAATLESRMIEPATWEPSGIDPQQFGHWNDIGLDLLAKASMVEEQDELRLYEVDSAEMLKYVTSASEARGSAGERMQALAEGLRTDDNRRMKWIVAWPTAEVSTYDAESQHMDDDIADRLERRLGKAPRVATRAVEVNDKGLVTRKGGGFSGMADRSLDFTIRSADSKGIELAVKALEEAFSKQRGSIWERGYRPVPMDFVKLVTIHDVEERIISLLRKEYRSKAREKTWDRWLRRPGEAFCTVQVFLLKRGEASLPRILLPSIVTPRSALAAYGMVPRERAHE